MDDDIYDAEESSEEEHDLVEEFIDKEMKFCFKKNTLLHLN